MRGTVYVHILLELPPPPLATVVPKVNWQFVAAVWDDESRGLKKLEKVPLSCSLSLIEERLFVPFTIGLRPYVVV